jgi:hypothetical protein
LSFINDRLGFVNEAIGLISDERVIYKINPRRDKEQKTRNNTLVISALPLVLFVKSISTESSILG